MYNCKLINCGLNKYYESIQLKNKIPLNVTYQKL